MNSKLFLSMVAAGLITTAGAWAGQTATTTDLKYNDMYTLPSTQADRLVTNNINKNDYKYNYETSAGTTSADHVYNEAITSTDFWYNGKSGATTTYVAGETKTSDSFSSASKVADNMYANYVGTGINAANDTALTTADYEYFYNDGKSALNGDKGEFVSASVGVSALTDTFVSNYVTVEVSSDAPAPELDVESYTYEDSTKEYKLSEDGETLKLVERAKGSEGGWTDSTNTDVFTALQGFYNNDQTQVNDMKTRLNAAFKNNEDNLKLITAATTGALAVDQAEIATLKGYWTSYDATTTKYNDAVAAKTDATTKYTKDEEAQTSAQDLYTTPILKSIKDGANEAITTALAANGAIKGAIDTATTMTEAGYNYDAGSVLDAVKSIDTAIGTTEDGTYVASANTVGQNINALDAALASGDNGTYRKAAAYTDARFNQLDHKIDRLEDKMEKGLAANAALAGLTPLSSEHKTQLSAAMGGYGSNQAVAVGGYHYITDSTLLNAGAAYGGNSDISYKVGITFGF